MLNYKEVLNLIEYPEEVLVIDFESYFDVHYTLSKLSTIEYIKHRMFEFTGVGCQFLNLPSWGDGSAYFRGGGQAVHAEIEILQSHLGKNFDSVTTVVKNAKFDIVVLQTKFGIVPKFIIDIDDLLRHYDARMSHKMKDVAPMFGLQAKGDTQQFKGLHHG